MSRSLRLAAQSLALLAVAGLLALLVWDVTHSNDGVAGKVQAGTIVRAPDFTLPRLDRPGTLRFSSLRGKAVVVNFWASWCVPCKEEAALLQRTSERWHSRGVVFLGIDGEDFPSRARSFLRRHHVTYLNVRDGDGSMIRAYGLSGYPETFFVDRQGRVVDHVAHQVSRAELEAGIRKALA